ncbi:MAG: hypothetical protein HGA98_03395, partial [Deltaproteobacteria bacterium]|nr:hypothetical protein [Deltaproteobacteria bacterium]
MADFDTFNAYVVEPLRLTRTWRTLRSEVDAGGLGLRRQKWQNPVTEFEVTLSFPDGVASAAFLAFFDAKR